jgi:heptosyltransferase-2
MPPLRLRTRPLKVNTIKSEKINRLLIFSTNWIGDAVMTTPALAAVRSTFFRAEITLVGNPTMAELFRHHPHLDTILVYDKKAQHRGIAGFARFSRQLRRQKFDLAIFFQNAFKAALTAKLAGVPLRAGYRTDGRGPLLSHAVSVGEMERRLHHTCYYLTMLKKLGIGGGDGLLALAVTEKERAEARRRLGAGNFMAINPGASYGAAKRWIPKRFALVGDRLAEEYGVRVVLTGGTGEKKIGQDIAEAMNSRPLNLIGLTTVRQMMAVISQCRLLVTNDSGPMHVAAALGVPIVAVFGPTDPQTTSPLSDRSCIVRKEVACAPCLLRRCPIDHRCMQRIAVADVMDGVAMLMESSA